MKHCLFLLLFVFTFGAVLDAQMDPYFTAINHPVPQDSMMVMLLSDFQSARTGRNFFTGMSMMQYGLTPRWTVGFMIEGQKIFGLPTTYGGLRVNSYFRVFPHDHFSPSTSSARQVWIAVGMTSAIPWGSSGSLFGLAWT